MNFSELPPEILQAWSEISDLPEDEQRKHLMEMFTQADVSIRGLEKAHSDLCSHLEEFEMESAVRLIGALDVLPELQDNSIRIQLLLVIALTKCEGSKKASADDLRLWVKWLQNSPVASQEDPPEDIFVGYVCSVDGGYRVFPGIISHSDFILERLLFFLNEKLDFPGFAEVYGEAINLLKLSEALAEKLELPRYYVDGDRPEDDFSLPVDSKIEECAHAVTFSQQELTELQIEKEKLEPFIYDIGNVENLMDESLFGSSIEQQPLLIHDGGILIASPSLLCRAAVIQILKTTPNLGGWADTFFEKDSAEFFVNDVLNSLDIKPLDGIVLPRSLPCIPLLYPYVGHFDVGMPVLAFIKTSSIVEGSDLEVGETFSDEQVDAFTKYVSECCEVLEGLSGFKGGLILLALSGVGRPIAIGIKDLRPTWHLYSSSLADWQTLASEHEFTARRLWYLGIQQKMVEDANTRITNVSGLLNLYGLWKQQHFVLLPQDINPHNPQNMMLVSGECSQPVNTELKNVSDRHCLWHPLEKKWIEVQRRSVGLNPDISINRIYGDYEAASRDVLRGCVALKGVTWWIEAGRPESSEAYNIVYRLWDCIINWSERIILLLVADYPDWVPREAVINIQLEGVEDWKLESISNVTGEATLSRDLNVESVQASLIIEEQFLTKFNQPDNIAEQEIVSVLISTFVQLSGCQPVSAEDINECVWRVIKDDKSRFFHVIKAPSLEAVIGKGNAKPLIIPNEELARVFIGLAHTVDRSAPELITDSDEARKFLDGIVACILARLSARLSEVSLISVVSYSFQQLDELSKDGFRWSLSTRSLLTLEDHAEWLQEHLRETNGRTTLTEIANRALIETAVYSCNSSVNDVISQTEHLSMLAEIATMIQIAGYRDAVVNGLLDAQIRVHPNGQIEYDDDFQEKIMQPYLTSRVDDQICWDAESYETNFAIPESEVFEEEDTRETKAFDQAFLAEFSFSHKTLGKLLDVFSEFSVRKGEGGGTLDDALLRQLLKNGIGLSDEQIEVFLDRFVLRIRAAWNKSLPKGCEISDVLPWRFYRPLSILVRPIVEVNQSPSEYAISATHLHRWYRYLTNSILDGNLPGRMFRSKEMLRYLGDLAQRKGEQFEKRVAGELDQLVSEVRHSIKMNSLGKGDAEVSDDVDVLAWDVNTGVVFLVECKRLKPTLTVAQVIEQLEKFRGDQTNSEDYLAKHLRRVTWIKENPEKISDLTGIAVEEICWKPLLVTSGRVPMSFLDAIDYPKEQVLAFQGLKESIMSILSEANQT